jgi:hypothetical protein
MLLQPRHQTRHNRWSHCQGRAQPRTRAPGLLGHTVHRRRRRQAKAPSHTGSGEKLEPPRAPPQTRPMSSPMALSHNPNEPMPRGDISVILGCRSDGPKGGSERSRLESTPAALDTEVARGEGAGGRRRKGGEAPPPPSLRPHGHPAAARGATRRSNDVARARWHRGRPSRPGGGGRCGSWKSVFFFLRTHDVLLGNVVLRMPSSSCSTTKTGFGGLILFICRASSFAWSSLGWLFRRWCVLLHSYVGGALFCRALSPVNLGSGPSLGIIGLRACYTRWSSAFVKLELLLVLCVRFFSAFCDVFLCVFCLRWPWSNRVIMACGPTTWSDLPTPVCCPECQDRRRPIIRCHLQKHLGGHFAIKSSNLFDAVQSR